MRIIARKSRHHGIHYLDMSPQDMRALDLALELMRRHTPAVYAGVMQRFQAIVFKPHRCGDPAIACVHANMLSAMFFRWHPADMDPIELAATLFHEAAHLRMQADGAFVLLPHTCGDCTDPMERAWDPIYRAEDAYRERLTRRILTDARLDDPLY